MGRYQVEFLGQKHDCHSWSFFREIFDHDNHVSIYPVTTTGRTFLLFDPPNRWPDGEGILTVTCLDTGEAVRGWRRSTGGSIVCEDVPPEALLADCPSCSGTGRLVLFTTSEICNHCHGRGQVTRENAFEQRLGLANR